jgi:ribosomal protein S27AE
MIQYDQETTEIDTEDDEICPECGTVMNTHTEQREGGYNEEVSECPGCGFTTIRLP